MSPNNGILPNGVLIPKLLNNPFASCCFISLECLLLHTAYFDDNINVPLLAFEAFGFIFLYFFFLHFKQYENMFYNNLCLIYERFRINLVPTIFFIKFLF